MLYDGWVILGYEPSRFPEAESMELPFIVTKSAEAASRTAWVLSQKHLADDFAKVHLIAAHKHKPGIVLKKGPSISSVADFTRLKLRGPSRAAKLLL